MPAMNQRSRERCNVTFLRHNSAAKIADIGAAAIVTIAPVEGNCERELRLVGVDWEGGLRMRVILDNKRIDLANHQRVDLLPVYARATGKHCGKERI